MICVTSAVVSHNCANVFRHRFKITDQILDRLVFEIGFAFDRFVDIVDVSLVMLGMVDFHRLRIDMRFQRIVRIR